MERFTPQAWGNNYNIVCTSHATGVENYYNIVFTSHATGVGK
ncbi:MAG: hypothetical protein Q4E28_04060 [Clostridia bacterium]|nr:hypothetical protein [Clostridia bacterium]